MYRIFSNDHRICIVIYDIRYRYTIYDIFVYRIHYSGSDKLTLKKDLEELKMSFIRSNYPLNLLNRLFVERPERPKVSIASPKIVYVGIKYYNDKSVKFAQRLAKIINKYNGAVKVVPYFKTGRKLLSYFSAKIKNLCKTHP